MCCVLVHFAVASFAACVCCCVTKKVRKISEAPSDGSQILLLGTRTLFHTELAQNPQTHHMSSVHRKTALPDCLCHSQNIPVPGSGQSLVMTSRFQCHLLSSGPPRPTSIQCLKASTIQIRHVVVDRSWNRRQKQVLIDSLLGVSLWYACLECCHS